MDTILSMRLFAKVVETGNFAEAARRLNLSPAMVTKHVQSLERRIGARLLNRTTRQFGLTEVGAIYYERCAGLLADFDEAESVAASLGRLPRGRLRVSTAVEFGASDLWPIVRAFIGKYPDISVDLVLTDRVADLIEEEIDVAIRMVERSLDPSLIARKLAVSKLVMCASPAYLRRAGAPESLDDLLAHRCLVYGDKRTHEGWTFSRGGRRRRIRVPSCLQSNQIRLLRQAAVDGLGIVMQPTFNVWQDIAEGRLSMILDDWSAGELGIHVAFPSRRFLPAKTRLFVDFLATQFPKGPKHDIWLEKAKSRPSQRG